MARSTPIDPADVGGLYAVVLRSRCGCAIEYFAPGEQHFPSNAERIAGALKRGCRLVAVVADDRRRCRLHEWREEMAS